MVSDAPYLTPQREGSGEREHSLREAFNGLRLTASGPAEPTAAMIGSLPLRSTPESGERRHPVLRVTLELPLRGVQ